MAKRLIDIFVSVLGLSLLLPVIVLFGGVVFFQDYCSPLYIAPRARRRGQTFNMVKLRSMIKFADKKGGTSTAADDRRITWVGKIIRKTKIDEVPQLWNVLMGDMSIVGPRPQVMRDVALYTDEEFHLFDVRPGITDFASIVFSDEGHILNGSENPDLMYNQIIRPWKSRLGLIYVRNHSLLIDLQLILFTVITVISRQHALKCVQFLLRNIGADDVLIEVAGRRFPLPQHPPPGANEVETRW